MDKMNSPKEIYQRYKKAQENIKVAWLVGGYKTDEEYHQDLLNNALRAINELKVSTMEDQTWEIQEYGYMGRSVS